MLEYQELDYYLEPTPTCIRVIHGRARQSNRGFSKGGRKAKGGRGEVRQSVPYIKCPCFAQSKLQPC